MRLPSRHGNTVALIHVVQILFRSHVSHDHATLEEARAFQIVDTDSVSGTNPTDVRMCSHVGSKMLYLDVLGPCTIMSWKRLLAPQAAITDCMFACEMVVSLFGRFKID